MSLIGLMTRPASENAALVKIAKRRYPDVPALLAVEMVLSDRRHAGLGALDAAKRHARGPVQNRKTQDLLTGNVRYDLTVNREESWRYPRGDPWPSPGTVDVNATIQMERVPARCVRRVVPVERYLLDRQIDRNHVAQLLRLARREIREAP